jgi:hypothetical protein
MAPDGDGATDEGGRRTEDESEREGERRLDFCSSDAARGIRDEIERASGSPWQEDLWTPSPIAMLREWSWLRRPGQALLMLADAHPAGSNVSSFMARGHLICHFPRSACPLPHPLTSRCYK